MGHLNGAVSVPHEGVFRLQTLELRDVDVAGSGVGLDRALDLELARINVAVEHLGRKLGHAGVARNDGTRGKPVGVRSCMDCDLHVQPLVAVDDVIAAATHDRVAAVAAEDDLASIVYLRIGSQRVELGLGQPEDLAQAGDACDAFLREEAALVTFRAALGGRQTLFGDGVGACQLVVEARAGQSLDRFIGVLCAELRGLRIFVEHDPAHEVGIDREVKSL